MSNSVLAKDAADIVSGAVVFGALADVLPAIAAGFSIIWLGIRIYEYGRVRWFGRPPRKTNLHE